MIKTVNNYYGYLVVVYSNPVPRVHHVPHGHRDHHARRVHHVLHHLVGQSFVCIVLGFDYLLLGKSFLKEKLIMDVIILYLHQINSFFYNFYLPCFISKILSLESTKLLTLSANCRASDCNLLGSLRCITTV